jgi:acyl transferase domain-containing protein
MDPQQRQLLEVAFECIESAGITLEDVTGQDIGCYIGNFTTDFALLQTKDPEMIHRYSATGTGTTILANRISHCFNLKGPSVTIDTACSSSIYALHQACAALRSGECDAAFVGGANLIQTPDLYFGTVKAGMTSGTGACHTFDISADGYAKAEGVGVLLVKRLGDAIRAGDPIRSVIRGTAVNR